MKSVFCDLGVQKEINRTRLKEKIFEHFPQAQEQSDDKNIVLVFAAKYVEES